MGLLGLLSNSTSASRRHAERPSCLRFEWFQRVAASFARKQGNRWHLCSWQPRFFPGHRLTGDVWRRPATCPLPPQYCPGIAHSFSSPRPRNTSNSYDFSKISNPDGPETSLHLSIVGLLKQICYVQGI